ncbi:MAG: lauroyl acyltransferase [Rhodospirillales bacterium]|nr:lauroyl acyltransferase [Rhodospirillales bacterium]
MRWLEALLVRLGFGLLGWLSPERASNLGGAVARAIGPWLPVSRVADANLRRAWPAMTKQQRQAVIGDVWENLGRTVGEMPHVASLGATTSGPGWEIEGIEFLAGVTGAAVLFSAHLGNWEVMPRIAAVHGAGLATFYRAADNPAVDAVIVGMRGRATAGQPQFAKGAAGARLALAHLHAGGRLGLLADQKMNDGIAAPFFGRMAMTASAPATLALRFNCPLIPGHCIRIGPARFRVRLEPPLVHPATGDRARDVAELTSAMNAAIERWVRETPGQWLWLHRRWPKEK